MQSSLTKQPGTVIDDRYEIESLLGVGGMSAVYRALDRKLNRVVALKMLHPHITEHRGSAERFLQEAKAQGLIRHPNVIGVYAVSATSEGHLYIVMDYLQGQSLAEMIKDGPLKDQSKAVDLFLQTCRGLEAAHANGIVHRDLKPSNVMLVDEGRTVKLVDFGIARLYSQHNSEQRLTKEGAVLGSPEYMSPEQCEGQVVDTRSDIYSMGCLMFEILSGHVPFDGDSQIEIMCKHVSSTAPLISASAPWVAPGFDAVLATCLEKDPGKRYQTAAEMLRALEMVDPTNLGSQNKPHTNGRVGLAAKVGGTRRWVAAAAASLLLAGAAIAVIHADHGERRRRPAPAAVPPKTQAMEPGAAIKSVIEQANQLWNAGNKTAAVAKYDDVLNAFRQNASLFAHTDITRNLSSVAERGSRATLKSSLYIATKLLEYCQTGQSRAVAEAAAKVAARENEPLTQGHLLLVLAQGDAALSQPDSVVAHVGDAVAAFKRAPSIDTFTYQRLFELVTTLDNHDHNNLAAARVAEDTYALAQHERNQSQAATGAYEAGLSYRMAGDLKDAALWYQKCLLIAEKTLPQSNPLVYRPQCEAGLIFQKLGQNGEAKRYFDKCRPYIEKLVRENPSPEVRFNLRKMAELYRTVGENKIAGKLQTLETQ